MFYGVTTNPLILRQAGVKMDSAPLIRGAGSCAGGQGAVLSELGEQVAALEKHGQMVAGIGEKVVVKLPATKEGFEAAARLAKAGSRVCITAVYASFQALLAASVGASYAAPYLGRMNDAGRDGHGLIAQMSEALRYTCGSRCEILAASVRSPRTSQDSPQNPSPLHHHLSTSGQKLFAERLTLEATKAFEAAAKELE